MPETGPQRARLLPSIRNTSRGYGTSEYARRLLPSRGSIGLEDIRKFVHKHRLRRLKIDDQYLLTHGENAGLVEGMRVEGTGSPADRQHDLADGARADPSGHATDLSGQAPVNILMHQNSSTSGSQYIRSSGSPRAFPPLRLRRLRGPFPAIPGVFEGRGERRQVVAYLCQNTADHPVDPFAAVEDGHLADVCKGFGRRRHDRRHVLGELLGD